MRNLLINQIASFLNQFGDKTKLNRRKFIEKSSTLVGTLALCTSEPKILKKPICIVGAGISGLYAGYLLKRAGYEVNIYEASNRTGGRISSINFTDKLSVDIGGEFINADHTDILELCKMFNLELIDIRQTTLNSTAYFFEGRKVEPDEIIRLLTPHAQALIADIDQIPDLPTYKNAAEYAHFDALSIKEYLQSKQISGLLYRIFEAVFVSEYGMDIEKQSAINLLYALKVPETSEKIRENGFFGEGSEIYKVRNGSQAITNELTGTLCDNMFVNHQLTDIAAHGEGYRLTFSHQGKNKIIEADYLLLTLPFTRLRRVRFHNIEIPERKKLSIQKYRLGNNAKAIYRFSTPIWQAKGESGHTYSDQSSYCSWEASFLKGSSEYIYTHFSGGKQVLDWARNKEKRKEKHLAQIQQNFGDIKDAFEGLDYAYFWHEQPLIGGSYTAHPKGFWSKTVGCEAEPIGNIYFAGEHCSIVYQGFMNGAAETGRQAAEMIVQNIKNTKKNE